MLAARFPRSAPMSQYRKILLIADPEMRVTPAFHRADRLARASGAELHICLFDYSRAVNAIGAVSHRIADVLRVDLIRQRELWLMRRADHLRNAGVNVRT